ncbi:AraC family transcriptional regulator [Streptomyces sp. NPDC048172]|uniref:AraC family transcriptional regulator n=1 Tax=Streptomyces sp. NPDC048172 TaxID=3365505 RepID=UPI003717AC23
MDDALSSLLHDVRPRGALFDQTVMRSPWSLRFEEGAPLTLLTLLSGEEAWVTPDGGDGAPVALRPFDVVLVVGPAPYTVADSPGTAPMAVVHEGDRCTTPDGRLILDEELPWCTPGRGPVGGSSAVALKGTYQVHGSVSQRVLTALPPLVHLPAPPEGCPPLDMIAAELDRPTPGRQVVLDRLLDLLLVTSLREWFDTPGAHAPAWYRAHSDPVVGTALRLVHDDPARAWTVASLAAETGTSRARFAQRFTELVGQPPMAYLTEWRICQAADLLATTGDTVDAVARRVGYSTSYALSVAFKRTLGIRPTEHRALARRG